ncbi:hypothetical protein MD484_g1621, partial [Candolleomyces efflorescens]
MSFRPTDGVAQIYMVAIGPPSSPIQKSRITSWGLILLDEEDPSNATLHFIVPKPKRTFYECDQLEMVLADPLKVDLTAIANPPPSALGWNWYGVPFGTSLGHTTGLLKPGCRLEVSASYTLLSFVFIGKSHFLGSVLGYELFRRRIEESLALHPRITSDGQQFTTFIAVTTVIAPGTVISTTARPVGAKSNNTGAIVGGVVGGIGGLVLLALLGWFLVRRKRKAELDEHFDGNFDPEHVTAAATGASHHHRPPGGLGGAAAGGVLAHHRKNSSLGEQQQQQRVPVNLDDTNSQMSMLGGAMTYQSGAPSTTSHYPPSTYPATSSSYYPPSSHSPPPQSVHQGQTMSMSSHGTGSIAPYGQQQGYGGGEVLAGNVPLGPAAYYGRNEKQVLSPPGQPYQPQQQGGYQAMYNQGGPQHTYQPYQHQAEPASPTNTTTTSSGGMYGGYHQGPGPLGRGPSPEPTLGGSSSQLAYGASVTGTSVSGSGAQSAARAAKEREARGPHVVNVTEDGGAAGGSGGRTGGQGPVVQHRDGGRVEEGEGPSEIPPAYDSIVRD